MSKFNLILKIILFIGIFIAAERFTHKETRGFALCKIYSDLPFDPEREVQALSAEQMETIRTLLSQPYHFLDSGGEAYAFISEDKKTVLKFFKQHHMRPKSWLDPLLPQAELNRRKMRFNRFFTSCKIAFKHFREQSGLLYVHLNKSDDLNIKLTLYDPLHIAHQVNLDDLEFALQKKVTMAKSTFSILSEKKDFETAKKRLDSVIDLIFSRCNAGLSDHDAQLRNFGFLDNQAISVDLGSLSLNETVKTAEGTTETLLQESMKMRKWIKNTYPELEPYLDEKIQEHLNQPF